MSTDKDKEIEDDYIAARQNYHNIICQMMDDLEEYSLVAKETEHPRAFEVLFNGYKAAAEMNDKFLEHQRKYQVIAQNSVKSLTPTVEGHVFSGSIADFQRKLIENKKKKITNDTKSESSETEDVSGKRQRKSSRSNPVPDAGTS